MLILQSDPAESTSSPHQCVLTIWADGGRSNSIFRSRRFQTPQHPARNHRFENCNDTLLSYRQLQPDREHRQRSGNRRERGGGGGSVIMVVWPSEWDVNGCAVLAVPCRGSQALSHLAEKAEQVGGGREGGAVHHFMSDSSELLHLHTEGDSYQNTWAVKLQSMTVTVQERFSFICCRGDDNLPP